MSTHKTRKSPGPMSAEQKAKMSRSAMRAWDRFYETIGKNLPTTKRCNACGNVKPAKEFYVRRKKRRNGEIYLTLAPECNLCARARAARVRASRSTEQAQKMRRRWNANRDKEKVRAYNREYSRMRRERDGVPPKGGWRKYRQPKKPNLRLNPHPFLDWFEHRTLVGRAPVLNDAEERMIRRLHIGEQATVNYFFVDEIMTRVGAHDQIHVLYPYIDETAQPADTSS